LENITNIGRKQRFMKEMMTWTCKYLIRLLFFWWINPEWALQYVRCATII